MEVINNIRIVSYNCIGVKNKFPVIYDLCEKCDLVLLQETWLLPSEANVLSSVHEEFSAFSLSAVDEQMLLVGRPYGGLSILWRNNIDSFCRIVNFGESRILGMNIVYENINLMLLNVYLPYYCPANIEDYSICIGKIASIIENYDTNQIMILGDLNAGLQSPFYNEWLEYTAGANLIFSDVQKLPSDSYTHINFASLQRKWLDHCISSLSVHAAITSIAIDYSFTGSDHLPLCVRLRCDALPSVRLVNSENLGKI